MRFIAVLARSLKSTEPIPLNLNDLTWQISRCGKEDAQALVMNYIGQKLSYPQLMLPDEKRAVAGCDTAVDCATALKNYVCENVGKRLDDAAQLPGGMPKFKRPLHELFPDLEFPQAPPMLL